MIRQQPNHFPNSPQWHGNLPTMARKSSCDGTTVTLCFAISSHCSTSDKMVAGLFLFVACILVCHQRLSLHCWLACLLILSFLTRSNCSRFPSIATLPRRPSEKARPRAIATLPRTVARTNRRGYPPHILDTSTATLPLSGKDKSPWIHPVFHLGHRFCFIVTLLLRLRAARMPRLGDRFSSSSFFDFWTPRPKMFVYQVGWLSMMLFRGLRDQVIF